MPDQFALFLVDFSSPIPQPLFDTSGGGALFAIDLGGPGGLDVFHATDTPPEATWTVTDAAIPEPGVLLLFATGLLGLVCRRWC